MRYEDGMMARHVTIEQLPYGKPVQRWLKDRYGETEADQPGDFIEQNSSMAADRLLYS